MSSAQKRDLGWLRLTYEKEGYAVVRDVLDRDLLQEMSRHVDWLLAHNPDVRPERLLGHPRVADDPFWCRVISDDRLLDIVEQLIGPNIAFLASGYFSKPAFDGLPVLWHQDGNYYPMHPEDAVIGLWIAVDHSTPENGCLRVIRGTHRMDFKQHVSEENTPNAGNSKISEQIDESVAVDLILKRGDVSIHSPRIVHGSRANNSPHRRCGIMAAYVPTSTRIQPNLRGYTNEQWPTFFVVRGRAVEGVNEYIQMPRYNPSRHMRFRGCENWM